MQSYTAPLADFRFLLEDVFDYPGEVAALSKIAVTGAALPTIE